MIGGIATRVVLLIMFTLIAWPLLAQLILQEEGADNFPLSSGSDSRTRRSP